ncbi:TonB-dependent receptor [Pseudoflavitalea sp. X16]|uniref:TonB-dependent receptor plug domain-containing protein n=1 Tax=Paraflavitalea devenefica TaxID=2716334 RepID=UPI00141DE29D|nr:TonB-dependent receptor [Paraflavitalea devenefica]NII23958.1 TonB-dependent receptor [Paraflavitalea devenefica]
MTRRLLTLSALLAAMYTQAQDSTNAKSLDQVVITATKYPVKLSETGKVVTVIGREQIERSSGKSLAQVLTEQTGIIVNGANSNPGKDKSIFLRGASNDYTLILLDGIPVNDPSGSGGAFDLRLFPVEQIDHIEILKGSQSTLYGSDAVAGVINIITKKKGTKAIGFNGGATYGSFNTFTGDAGVSGHTKVVDYNINYSYTNTDGISEAVDTTGKAAFDKDGFTRQSVQANLAFRVNDKIKIAPYYRYSHYKGDFDADAFTDGTNTFRSLLNNTGAIATIALPKGTITANYGYSYSKRNYVTGFGSSFFRGKFHSGDVYLTQALNGQVKMLAGVNYQSYQLLDTTLEKKNPETSIISPYLSFFIQSDNGLHVEVGGRYNRHSEFGSHFTYSFNTSYLINQEVKVFANISSGFKAPTVFELFGPTFYGSNPKLKPEQSTNIEAGVQLQTWQHKLQLTATGFYRDIKDLIAYVGNQSINIDEQKDKGAELEVTVTPDEKWSIKASYTYVTGNIYQTRSGKDTSYYNLLRRPKSTIVASVGYQATKQLYISIAAQSLGKRTDLFFESVPPYGTIPVNLKAYTLLNAYAEYKLLDNKVRLFVDAKNLTDASYTEVYGYNTPGINIQGGFRINL